MMYPRPEQTRSVQRLVLAAVLVVLVGFSFGLDGAVAVALCLAVMEVAGHLR
jgi:hypothetical protein